MNLSPDLQDWAVKGHARQRIMQSFGDDGDRDAPGGIEFCSLRRATEEFRRAVEGGAIVSGKAVEVRLGRFTWVLNPVRGILVTVRDAEREEARAEDYRLWQETRQERRAFARRPGAQRAHDRHLARRVRRWHQPEGRGRRAPSRYGEDA